MSSLRESFLAGKTKIWQYGQEYTRAAVRAMIIGSTFIPLPIVSWQIGHVIFSDIADLRAQANSIVCEPTDQRQSTLRAY
jgi:hypothetical protein